MSLRTNRSKRRRERKYRSEARELLKRNEAYLSKLAAVTGQLTKKETESIFEPGSMRVKQSFLDVLNGESNKMTAALQNPANFGRIMQAAKEAPEAIRKMEAHMGIGPAGKVGKREAISRGTAEATVGEELPEHVPPVTRRTHSLDSMQTIRRELEQMEHLAVSAARWSHDSDIDSALRKVYLKARDLIAKIDRGEFR